MIITDYTKIIEILNMLLEKEAYIRIDRKDIDEMFPDKACLQLINVAGSDEEAIINAFNEDYASIHDEPRSAVAFILGQSLNMSGLATLNDGIPCLGVYKRAILFETSDAGKNRFLLFLPLV